MRTEMITAGVLAVLFVFVACHEQDHEHVSMPGGEISPGSIYDLDLMFTNRRAESVPLNQLAGGPLIFSMIYTRCTSVCPTQAGNMLRIQNALAPEDREKVRFVLMSFDPDDSSADLAEFGSKLGLKENWRLLGGDPDMVRQLAAALGFQYRKNPGGEWSHSAAIYLFDAKGAVRYRSEGLQGKPDEFAKHLKHL
ncbi:MAG: SCO family protein [bacterium]|nr:SCO family protein [bacterium]